MATGDTGDEDEVFHLEGGIPVFNARLNQVERKQAEAETRDENYKTEQLGIDRRVMYFTGVLVACSLLSALVSGYQAHVASISANAAKNTAETASSTLTEIKKSGTDTRALADAAGKQATNTDKLVTAAVEQAANTKESLERSEKYFQLSEQPYITFGRKDGLLAQLTEAKDPDQAVTLVLYLQNAGRLPAQTVCVWTQVEVRAHNLYSNAVSEGQNSLLIRERKANVIGIKRVLGSACPSIGGDSIYAHTTEKAFQQKTLEEFRRARKESTELARIDIKATVQYCDAFGQYSCQTAYLSYGQDRIDSFRLNNVFDCRQKYGDEPPINPSIYRAFDAEPLLPCASPSEQIRDAKQAARAFRAEVRALNPPPP